MYKFLIFITSIIYFATLLFFPNFLGFFICIFLTFIAFSLSKRRVISNYFFIALKKNKLYAFLYLIILGLSVFALNLFRINTNIEYAFKNTGEIIIQTNDGYQKPRDKNTKIKYNELHENDKVKIQSINFKRINESIIHSIENFLNPNQLVIIEFKNNNQYSLTADTDNNLKPIDVYSALKISKANFAINTNYYDENKKALGEVIIDNKRYSSTGKKYFGFFKVINGKPIVGTPKLIAKKYGVISYSCQGQPSVIGNGKLWRYIKSESSNAFKPEWKEKTYRNLVGTLKNGNLVCILSYNGGYLSVKEIAEIALKYGVVNAFLFDGGAALQYKYQTKNFNLSFSAVNNRFNLGKKIDSFFLKKGFNFPAKSPVFLTVKH